MLPTGRRPTCSASSKTWATVRTGRSPASSAPAPRIRHGITGEELVVLHRRREDGADQPVGLGRHRDGHAAGQQRGAPFPDHAGRQLPDRYAAQVRIDVLTQQPPVEVHRARAQPGPFGDPCRRVLAEFHLAALGIGPLARSDLGFDHHERSVSVAPSLVGFRPRPHPPVRSRIADLIPPGLPSADVAETPVTFSVRHYATPFILCRISASVSGSTRPASMKSASADSLIRTWRPTLTNSMRRSAINRRMNRGDVLSRSAAASTVSSDWPRSGRVGSSCGLPVCRKARPRPLVGAPGRVRSAIGCGRRRRAAAAGRWACGPGRRA